MASQPRIYILGIGNIGRLFAHALAMQPNQPPITLLLHRSSLLSDWDAAGRKVSITTDGVVNSNGSFDVELSSSQGPLIQNLIVATKTLHTVAAISPISPRLNANSTILYTQNGMGTVDEVTSSLFPDNKERPSCLAAITSHGVYSQGPFNSVHAGKANVTIGHLLNSASSGKSEEQSRYLLEQVVNAKVLAATEVSPLELKLLQLEKLVGNAMLNPLTAIFRCKNGELYNRPPILDVMRRLLGEVSAVLLSLPEVEEADGGKERFGIERLEKRVLGLAEATAENTSSMLQDVLKGSQTEIDYINGWIVRKGAETGLVCKYNEILVGMVKEARSIGVDDIKKFFPE